MIIQVTGVRLSLRSVYQSKHEILPGRNFLVNMIPLLMSRNRLTKYNTERIRCERELAERTRWWAWRLLPCWSSQWCVPVLYTRTQPIRIHLTYKAQSLLGKCCEHYTTVAQCTLITIRNNKRWWWRWWWIQLSR